MIPKQRFEVGEAITAIGFKDCFGKQQEPVAGLIVEKVTLIMGWSIDPYYRVYAINPEPHAHVRSVEAAERFFSKGGR